MYVIKANGKKEEFNPEKIRGSLTRARVDRAISDKIIEQVEKEVFDGISTGAIFKRVMALLNESSPSRASCYDLKEAIMRLGPAGFPFETFIAEILREHGFQTVLRTRLMGKCAEHEIDVIATDNMGKRFSNAGYMLVKDLLQEDFRNIRRKTGLKDRKIRKLLEEAREIFC